MPNWCYNYLDISGDETLIADIKRQLNKPFVKDHDSWNATTGQMEVSQTAYSNPVFAFHNIYNHRDAGITDEVYLGQPPRDITFEEQMQFKTNDWYSFNVREWGTKWDVAISEDNKYPDTTIEEAVNGENYVVHYNFETAWSRPVPALEKLSAQYPTLLFTLSYEEETGWGGEMEFLRGEIISESEYDNMCRECDKTDCMEWCEECEDEVCIKCQYNMVESCSTHGKVDND